MVLPSSEWGGRRFAAIRRDDQGGRFSMAWGMGFSFVRDGMGRSFEARRLAVLTTADDRDRRPSSWWMSDTRGRSGDDHRR